MALDPQIALGVRVAPFDVRIPSPVDRYARMLSMRQLMGQSEAQQQLAEQRRFALEQSRLEAERETQLRTRLLTGQPLTQGEAYGYLGAKGGAQYLGEQQKAETARIEAGEKQRTALSNIAGSMLQANSQEGFDRGLMEAGAAGIISQDELHQLMGSRWDDPAVKSTVQRLYYQGIPGKEQQTMRIAAAGETRAQELHAPQLAEAQAKTGTAQAELIARTAPDNQAAWDVWHSRLPEPYKSRISPKYSPTEQRRVQTLGIKPEIGKTIPRPADVQAQVEAEDAAKIRTQFQTPYGPQRFQQETTLRTVGPAASAAARGAPAQGDNALIEAVKQNPTLYNDLTSTVKGRIAGRLASQGFKDFGRDLSNTAITKIAEVETGLASIRGLIPDMEQHKDLQGPIAGLLAKVPYAEQARTLQAHIDMIKQRVGKAFEGGVLRKEDEAKYARILPTMQDTPTVALNKARMVEKELAQDLKIYINTQMAAGRRVPESMREGGGAPTAGGAPKISTKEEYDKLPSGAQYVDSEDGKTYTKR